jgi:ribosomal protein L9
MNVYLLKDIEKIGLAGQIIKVKSGFADNFLVPQKLLLLQQMKLFIKAR